MKLLSIESNRGNNRNTRCDSIVGGGNGYTLKRPEFPSAEYASWYCIASL